METVRVDLRKLQILNDRINQTIDALTQLRQSVHGFQPAFGLQHSAQFGYGVPFAGPYGMPQAQIAGAVPAMGSAITGAYVPQAAFGMAPWIGQTGLAHSSVQGIEASWGRLTTDPATAFRNGASSYNPWGYSQQLSPVVAF